MAFFDRPNIYPPPQGKIKLQEFDNNDDRAFEHGIDGSGDYAVNKGAILCFLCDYNFMNLDDDNPDIEERPTTAAYYESKRLVTFKGFVEDLQIKLNMKYTDEGGFNSVVKSKYLEDYLFGYSLVFNVVAHSVNEAVSNANRFSELERIVTYPFDAGYNLGDSDPGNKIPNSYVLLSNLINNGSIRYSTNWNINNAFVRKHGLRMAATSIKMEPDLDMGVFEFNNKTYFKSFKISLEIPITNLPFADSYTEEIIGADRNKTLIPYVLTSSVIDNRTVNYYDYKKRPSYMDNEIAEHLFDTRGFPFCIKHKPAKILTSYAQGVRAYGSNKHLKLGICINDSDITQENNPYITQNYCVFDAFIESFSYEKKQEATEASFQDPVASAYSIGASGEISFNLSVNIPSYSVVDGETNCMKINSLFRMIPIYYYKPDLPGGPVKVLLNNLIKDPKSRGSNGNYDFSDIFNNGLACEVASMNINIDNEAGFFEYRDYFIPKAMKLDLQLIIPHKAFGNILINKLDETAVKTYNSEDSRYWPML